jgi:hypothetical protein
MLLIPYNNSPKWHQITSGDTIKLRFPLILKIACCDCGLTHDFFFKKRERGVEVTITRNDRSTKQIRKGKKHLCVPLRPRRNARRGVK